MICGEPIPDPFETSYGTTCCPSPLPCPLHPRKDTMTEIPEHLRRRAQQARERVTDDLTPAERAVAEEFGLRVVHEPQFPGSPPEAPLDRIWKAIKAGIEAQRAVSEALGTKPTRLEADIDPPEDVQHDATRARQSPTVLGLLRDRMIQVKGRLDDVQIELDMLRESCDEVWQVLSLAYLKEVKPR